MEPILTNLFQKKHRENIYCNQKLKRIEWSKPLRRCKDLKGKVKIIGAEIENLCTLPPYLTVASNIPHPFRDHPCLHARPDPGPKTLVSREDANSLGVTGDTPHTPKPTKYGDMVQYFCFVWFGIVKPTRHIITQAGSEISPNSIGYTP